MGTLTVSTLNDVSTYRSSASGLTGKDVMEISLSGNTGYVSAKCTLDNLKAFLNNVPANTTYKVFDIFYRTIRETPLQISYINGVYGQSGSLYSAWPLFIDQSASPSDQSVNIAAPNWVAQGLGVQATYTTFWSKLSAATNGFIDYASPTKIKWEPVNINNSASIANSVYMQEYNSNGYTGRFLIDVSNGAVALPILNNTFIRNVSGGGDWSKSEVDTLQNITGTFDGNVNDGDTGKTGAFYKTGIAFNGSDGTGYGGLIGFDSSRVVRTSTETKPKNVRYSPYMQIANTITELDILDINGALSGLALAQPVDVSVFATSGSPSMTKVITPYALDGGFAYAGNQCLSSNGFQKLPGGFIMQWGYKAPPLVNVSHTGQPIAFPTPFPNSCFSISVTPDPFSYPAGLTNGNAFWAGGGQISNTGFVVFAGNGISSINQNTNTGVWWTAIGH